MPERLPISVFVIALNEADRIGRTLASVADWADEVIVIDSGSTDGTCDIARAAGARVITHDWPGYGQQKIFGEQQCRNRWLLNLDADEVVSPALADSIRSFINGDTTGIGAAAFRWQMVHWRDSKPRFLAPSHRFVRLYDRQQAGFADSPVHDSVAVTSGEIADLTGRVWHHSFRSLAHFRAKLFNYAESQASDMVARGRVPSAWRIGLEPLLGFLRLYILRRYFIYGMDGMTMSLAYGKARFLRLKRAREKFIGTAPPSSN